MVSGNARGKQADKRTSRFQRTLGALPSCFMVINIKNGECIIKKKHFFGS